MGEKTFDTQKSEAFAEKMIDVLNAGALALMSSIGHQTGLFDTMKHMSRASSGEIAKKAGLNERYVREWLGAMVTSGVVECDQEGPSYFLPAEHAAWLVREATPDNIAVFAQYIPLLGSVEERIIECFKKGGGVPYLAYKRFHQVMAEDSGQTVVAALIDSILPLAPNLVDSLRDGIDVLDVGCGVGRALNLMAKTYPKSRFLGYEFSREAIAVATTEAKGLGLSNVRFEEKDVSSLPDHDLFDLITAFDAIHDQAKPDKVLEGIAKALKPDGTFLMQDIAGSSLVYNNKDHPVGPLLYTLSCMHCMSVSLAQNGAGLGAMWGEEKAREMLNAAGFARVEVKKLQHDFQNCYYIVTKN